jgi:SAM-dependent methyltransferase
MVGGRSPEDSDCAHPLAEERQVELNEISNPSVLYHEGYQDGSVEPKSLLAAHAIASAIWDVLSPGSVLDVGSGAGALVNAFQSRGIRSKGVDGSIHVKHVAERVWGGGQYIDVADLRLPYSAGAQFDCVTCFDVAEHIEGEFSRVLVRTLVNNTRLGGYVVLGPAPEGQDGVGHVNLQHPTYWISKMEQYGCKLLPERSEILREKIRKNPDHAHLWWIAKNLMVFYV